MRVLQAAVLICTAVILQGCGEQEPVLIQTAVKDASIFRTNLDKIPRVLVYAPGNDLSAAYDVDYARLYKTWKGGANYSVDSARHCPWQLYIHGQKLPIKVDYLGYSVKEGRATIAYRISLQNRDDIIISETPVFTQSENKAPVFTRIFETSGVPDSARIVLHTRQSSIASSNGLVVEGGTFEKTSTKSNSAGAYDVEGNIVLKNNGETKVVVNYVALPPGVQEVSSTVAINGDNIPEPHKRGTMKFEKIPASVFGNDPEMATDKNAVEGPGFGSIVEGTHPSLNVTAIAPEGFHKSLSALEFLPDGSLAVATWDSSGSIYILEGVQGNDRSKVTARLFAKGLYEVRGLQYVGGSLYALQKWELTEVSDTDGDGTADAYRAVADDWADTANFDENDFGLLYKDGFFYFNSDPGKAVKVNKSDWNFEVIDRTYNAPDDIGFMLDGGRYFEKGPYSEGQMIFGNLHGGGLHRAYIEKVNLEYQGAIFRFTQGLGAAINRLAWGPDSSLYIAGRGRGGNFAEGGLQKISYNEKSTLDILRVSARADGMEIEFTEPLRIGDGVYISDYTVQQFAYEAGNVLGGTMKNNAKNLRIKSVVQSGDRKKIFLGLEGMKLGHVVYIKMNKPFISDAGNRLWTGEAWYILNSVPQDTGREGPTKVKTPNQLLEEEKETGWELLFDGKSLDNWIQRGDCRVRNGAIHLAGSGAMLVSDSAYKNFEFEFEWQAEELADAGVYFHLPDSILYAQLSAIYPEIQIADGPRRYNHSRLIVKDGHVEHWLNGFKVTEYNYNDKEWQKKWRQSFGNDPQLYDTGRVAIAVQKNAVSIRNVRIRNL
jgi:hypothetical protein